MAVRVRVYKVDNKNQIKSGDCLETHILPSLRAIGACSSSQTRLGRAASRSSIDEYRV